METADALDVTAEIENFQEIGERVIKRSLAKGASQVDIGIGKDIGLSVQVRNQDIDTLEYNRDNNFGLSVYFGHKKGTATTTDLSIDALDDAVDAACNIAKYAQDDPYAGLPEKSMMATESMDLELDMPMGITAEIAKDLALECELAGLSASTKVSQSEGTSMSSHRHIQYFANSHGFSVATPSTRHNLTCILLAEDSQGKHRDYWYSVSRNPELLESPQRIGERAAEKVLSRLGGRKITTTKAPVIMAPSIARGLVESFCSAIAGSSLYRQSSFLVDTLGEKIFPDFVQFDEKPLIKGGLASAWCDGEGLPSKEQSIVEKGVLQTYLLSCYSARKLGMQPTGHTGGVRNLHILPMDLSLQQMIAKMHKGLVVTNVMGQGVNLVNGDYSRGAAGFWVEHGKIQHFVEEITIAGNLKDMFSNIVAISNDLDYRSSILTGSWLLEEMTIAGE